MARERLTYDTPEIQEILDSVSGKQNVITDLEDIRAGAAAGETALQSETDPAFSASPASGISSSDILSWNGKQDAIDDLSTIRSGASAGATAYQKPLSGIPSSDLTSSIRTSLGKADSAYQKPSNGIPASDIASGVIPNVAGKEDTSNKVTSVSSSSTDNQYPSAKCLYEIFNALAQPFSYEIVQTLPTASASTMGIFYLLTNGSSTNYYLTKDSSGTYSWVLMLSLPTSIATITNGEIDSLF